MNTETASLIAACCCSTVAALVTAWLWRRAATRYSKADARIDELRLDEQASVMLEHDKANRREEAHRREVEALQEKLAATEAARKDDFGLYRRGLAELLRLMQAVVSQAERLADGEKLEDRT